jgi:hypothetical protein
MALDKRAFWGAWKALGGMAQGIYVGEEPWQPPDFGPAQDAPEAPGGLVAEGGPEYAI